MNDEGFKQNKSIVATTTPGLKKVVFYCGQGMQNHWIETNASFMNYIEIKHGKSVKVSMMKGELVAVEVEESIFPKFKTEEEKD